MTERGLLPTMYDLPSENPDEPGVDQFHIWQPALLTQTFCPPDYVPDRFMVATGMYLYYDVRHPKHYKRPDWYAVLGVPYLYEEHDLRLSYVIWQEGVVPFVVVELLSPETEDGELRSACRKYDELPTKWDVYEQILGVPYYAVFDPYTDQLRMFRLTGGRYVESILPEQRMWLPELKLGLGVWHGTHERVERKWLRWFDGENKWIPSLVEQRKIIQQERKVIQQERKVIQQEIKILQQEKKSREKEIDQREKEKERREKEIAQQEKEIAQQRLQEERERTKKLIAQLKASGIEPDI
ncbi:Uma2 family endonuclease [Desulfobacterales bacterium HSG2]|nr:Uma2 family endonuclease [Desulfobacterales bacterium HSG2]